MTDIKPNLEIEPDAQESRSISRRKVVKAIASSFGAMAAYHSLPVNWSEPVIEQIFLPAHAAVSGLTLSDPCTIELVRGDQATSIDVIRVSGFVSPPVGGLKVGIAALPNGGSGGLVKTITMTGSKGAYAAEISMTGGPGIKGVAVATGVNGARNIAICTVGIPPTETPEPPNPDNPDEPIIEPEPDPLCPSQVASSPSSLAVTAVQGSGSDPDGINILFDGCANLTMFASDTAASNTDRLLFFDVDADHVDLFDIEAAISNSPFAVWAMVSASWGSGPPYERQQIREGSYQCRIRRQQEITVGTLFDLYFSVDVTPVPNGRRMTVTNLRAILIS